MSPIAIIAAGLPERGWPLIGCGARAAQGRTFIWFGLLTLAASAAVGVEKAKSPKPKVSPADQTAWHDCEQIGIEGKGWTDTPAFYDRLPAKAQGKAPASVWGLSRCSAGLCVRFTTDAPSIQVRWTLLSGGASALPHMPATGVSGVDFYAKAKGGQWEFVANGRPAAATNTASFTVPPGEQYLVYLPLYDGVKSVAIGIPKGRKIAAAYPEERKPIVIYGTSITQGGCASRPGMAWTSIVGRRLDTPVVNLGFSGSGKMEPAMADLLAELDPSVYVLDCIWNMSPEQVSERVVPFVEKLAHRIRTLPSCWPKIPAFRTNARRRRDVLFARPTKC